MSASESRDDSFEVETNNPFYFNTSHWRAVDGMLEGVRDRAGLMLLTGPTGSGKTMIMRAISEGLKENTPGLFLQYASLNFREFINFLHSSLHVGDEIVDAPNKAVALREFLYVQAKRDETGVVFIDEAHNLEPDVLRMLPKLARFDTLEDGRIVGLQFVLIASEDLREIMVDSEYDEVREKILVDHTLHFFTRPELKQFLKKRLAPIARVTDEPITEEGIEEMARFTGGSPRLIGMICSHTMLFAAENPGRSIDAKMVQEAAEALMLSPVENAFAAEESDEDLVTGPFSEADLSGEAPKPAKAPSDTSAPSLPFTAPETVYLSDDPDTVDSVRRDEEYKPLDDTAPTDGVEADDSLYAADHAAMGPAEDAPMVESGAAEDAADHADMPDIDEDDADFDYSDFDSALADDETDFDDDEDDDDDIDGFAGTGTRKPAVKKGGTSFLTRLGWRKPEGLKSAPKVMGASRKKEKPVDAPTLAASKRGPKTRVKGEREAMMKKGGIAAGVIAVLGLGYVASGPVISAVTGLISSPPQQQVAAGSATDIPRPAQTARNVFGETPSSDTRRAGDTVTVNVQNEQTTSTGGWGARVVVQVDDAIEETGPAIPAAAAGLARGALDLVDKALNASENGVKNDKVGGILAVASDKVAGLRDRIAKDGLTDEQAAEKAVKLIAEGDTHFSESRYISPSGSNAYDAYREALSLQPDNELAQAGITNLREHFAKKAEGARDARQWESANGFFETAIAISNLRAVK